MRITVNHCWYPAGPGRWHHFIVTRLPDGVRVAYELADGNGGRQIHNEADATADHVAEWELPPDARDAWRAQRAAHMAWLADAVREALTMLQPLRDWWRLDRERVEAHTRGSVSAQARIDDATPRPSSDEVRAMLYRVMADDHGLVIPSA